MDESTYDLLLNQGFSEEDIEYLMELGVLFEERSTLEKQRAQAEALAGTRLPRGRSFGRVYKSANPLEHFGAAVNRIRGQQQLEEYGPEAKRIADEQMQRRIQWLMSGRRAPGATVNPAPQAMTMGLGSPAPIVRRPI